MRRPRPLTGAALAAFTVAAAVAGVGIGPAASAETGPAVNLYVGDSPGCDDTGPGTAAEPFCTVQAAADVVLPGQTVHIAPPTSSDRYGQPVTLTRSGTPSAPITFVGDVGSDGQPAAYLNTASGVVPLTLKGVHDVHVDSLGIDGYDADLVDVTGSHDIVLDQVNAWAYDPDPSSDGVRVDGASSGVTVSRSAVLNVSGYGVRAEQGASDVTVTTDHVQEAGDGGVLLDGTTGGDVVSDSMDADCGPAVTMENAASGVVENDVLIAKGKGDDTHCAAPTGGIVSVDAASAGTVTADYDSFSDADTAHRPAYAWAGTPYATPAARTTATGAGGHDTLTADPLLTHAPPTAGSGAIDSADASAPGELSTDSTGLPHTDNPLVHDSGTGAVTYADRGAWESQDSVTVPAEAAPTPLNGAVPFSTSVPVDSVTSAWGEPLTYTVDFGDGGAPVTATAGDPPRHTYATPGAYQVTVTATDADGVHQSRTTQAVAATDDPAPLSLTAAKAGGDGMVDFTPHQPDAFEIASTTFSYGDGTSQTIATGTQSVIYQYTRPGDYTATLTETDVLGRVRTATARFRITTSYLPEVTGATLEHTIPAHGTWIISSPHVYAADMSAVEYRVNVRSSKDAGWLTAYPLGTARPSAATLNFPAGGGASNQETVGMGLSGATIYNGADSPADVTVREVGVLATIVKGYAYHPANPTTLADTRYGTGGVTGPIGAGKSLTVRVAGRNGVPADAKAVTLDVAENTTKASGSLTVAPHGTTGEALTASYWRAGESVTNLVTLPLTDGKVTLTNNSKGSANLIAALAGWYGADTTGSGAWPVTAVRVLNTRTGLGVPGGKALKLAAHGTLRVKVAGTAGLPATGLTAADLNLTVSAPTASGWLVAYPDGTTRPTAGALNYTKGHTIAGQALIKVGSDGYVDLYNPTSTAINVFADIHGAWLPRD